MPKKKITESKDGEAVEQVGSAETLPTQEEILMKNIYFDGKADQAPRRARKPSQPTAPIELLPEFLNDPTRMQYALLLALLLRQNGTVKFTAKDLEPADTEYNILFARTLDGKALEVTVVSATSGILKSPENTKGDTQWPHAPGAVAGGLAYQYQPPPLPPSMEDLMAMSNLKLQQMTGGNQETMQNVVTMTPQKPSPETPRDGSAPFQFPFEVGDRPSEAHPQDMSVMAQNLLQKDKLIAQQEAEAIARQESGQ